MSQEWSLRDQRLEDTSILNVHYSPKYIGTCWTLVNQVNSLFEIPSLANLDKRTWWSTISNAFLMSKDTAPVSSPLSMLLSGSSVTSVTDVKVEFCGLKPDWVSVSKKWSKGWLYNCLWKAPSRIFYGCCTNGTIYYMGQGLFNLMSCCLLQLRTETVCACSFLDVTELEMMVAS